MSRFFAAVAIISVLLAMSTCSAQSRYDPLNFYKYTKLSVCQDSLFAELVQPLGYPWEAHTTVTEDAYVLKLYRIQSKGGSIVPGNRVVFLQHGLIDSADNWVINEDKGSLGLILANKGYDVWLGNSRGNKYSRINNKVTPAQATFWDFSFQEMGQYDVKANIEYITRITGQKKLTYVGHSQGTSQMFAALSRPETSSFVNSKVNKFIALAPIVYLVNSASKLLIDVSKNTFFVDAAKTFGSNEWLTGACSSTSAQSQFENFVCSVDAKLCDWLLNISDYSPKYDNEARLPTISKHMPSGTSLRTLLHYSQYLTQKDPFYPVFNMYDFGRAENKRRYGQVAPPGYDLGLINIPIRGFVGVQDKLGDPRDNSIHRAKLDNLGKDYKDYVIDDCGHMTFMWPLYPEVIFKDVLAEIDSAK